MTAKTWNEVFTRLDAFVDGFSADVRAVADVDGTDEVEVCSLRAALEATERELAAVKAELCDELRASGEMDGYQGSLSVVARELECRAAKIESAHTAKASVDALVEKAARVMREASSNRHAFQNDPPWEKESQHVRAAWIATARALYAAGLLTNPERSTES